MHLRLLFTAVLASSLAACAPQPRVDEKALFGAIQANVQAMEREDIDAVMATIDPGAPGVDSMRELILNLFKKYDLKYEIGDLKLVRVKGDLAQVSFTQKTRRIGGEDDLGDNLVQGIHTLRKIGDQWKLLRSETLGVSPLPPP